MRPATDVMLASQLKTLPEPAWTPMNAKRENDEEAMSAAMGSPLRRVILNIEGAFPEIARPSIRQHAKQSAHATADDLVESGNSHSARELVYRSLDAADQAEVRRHAFMNYRDQHKFQFWIRESEGHKDESVHPGGT